MIVGPWYEEFLAASLMSTLGLVSEYVMVDTFPGQNKNREQMEELAAFFEAKIIDLPRSDLWEFSYAKARNVALKASTKEWILRLDCDEVLHENSIFKLIRATRNPDIVGIETKFYHHVISPNLHQILDDPKVILFRRKGALWIRKVHETVFLKGSLLKLHDIKFNHYGYCRRQKEVMERWKLYEKIEGQEAWYHNLDPDHILDERLEYIVPYEGTHPAVVIPTLRRLFPEEKI